MTQMEPECPERRGPDRVSASWSAPALNDKTRPVRGRSRSGGLPNGRLRRVEALIEARLSSPIRLVDMAAAAGLSRMHSAAQFGLATGASPHAFLPRRRIETAKHRLERTDDPLARIVLGVGVQAHAHFTTVFKRVTGQTPGRWRRSRRPPVDALAARS